MAFIEITSKKQTPDKSKVRITFVRRQNKKNIFRYGLIIRIGRDLADKINIMPGDKVSFSYDDENKRCWLIKKTNNLTGFKVTGRPSASSFILQLTWDAHRLFEPEENELKMRYVVSDIYQGGIKIDILKG